MPTQPPRRRFQIHLSTAIVMMFVVGVLLTRAQPKRLSKLIKEWKLCVLNE